MYEQRGIRSELPRQTRLAMAHAAKSFSYEIYGIFFNVAENCLAALRRMYSEDRDVTAWINVARIDKGSNVERNRQVRLVTEVYSTAREVFFSLGEGGLESESVLLR
jgi:hypothetical protein